MTDLESKEGSIDPKAQETLPSSPRDVHGIKWFLVVVATLSSIFVYSLDNTIVADIVPAIVNDFSSVDQLPWLSVGFMLGGTAVVLPFGKLFGLFNAKTLYILSSILFLAASALCGGAPNMAAEIVGRVLAGAGGNGMYLGVMTLLSVNTSDKERPAYLSLVGLVWGIGTVLGPVVGGAFEQVTWRWAFYINLIICGVFAPVYLFLLPSFEPQPDRKWKSLLKDFDFIGALFIIGLLTCVIMATNFGGVLYAWGSGQIIALYVVAGVLTFAFAVQQHWTIFTSKATRMFPMHFLTHKDPVLLFICAAACNTAGFVTIYYIPLYFQFTRGDNGIESAVRLLPLIFLLSAAILLNGQFMSRFGYHQPWYIGGSILAIAGGAVMSTINENTSVSTIYGLEVLLGLGTGAFIQAGYAVIQTVVQPEDMSYAISFMMLAQLGGIALGLSISGAVFVNEAVRNLSKVLPNVPHEDIVRAVAGTSGEFFSSLPNGVRETAVHTLVIALRKVFIPVYVGAAVALVASCFLRWKKVFIPMAAGA